jgi:hypothetical protein
MEHDNQRHPGSWYKQERSNERINTFGGICQAQITSANLFSFPVTYSQAQTSKQSEIGRPLGAKNKNKKWCTQGILCTPGFHINLSRPLRDAESLNGSSVHHFQHSRNLCGRVVSRVHQYICVSVVWTLFHRWRHRQSNAICKNREFFIFFPTSGSLQGPVGRRGGEAGVIGWRHRVRESLEITGDTFFSLETLPVKSYLQITAKNGGLTKRLQIFIWSEESELVNMNFCFNSYVLWYLG